MAKEEVLYVLVPHRLHNHMLTEKSKVQDSTYGMLPFELGEKEFVYEVYLCINYFWKAA